MSDQHTQANPLRIAVLISGGGSTLANIAERINDGRLKNITIVQVISSRRDVRGVEIAQQANLPLEIVRKKDFADWAAFSESVTEICDRANVDLVVMGGFLCFWIYPPRYEGRVINIHPALLPKFGGRGMFGHHVHEAVLAAGELESGCTVHLVDHQYDHGRTIGQRRVPVETDDTPDTLSARVGIEERELLPEVLQQIANNGTDWLQQF